MKIIPNQDFKHDGQLFVEGESYDVSDEDAGYFQECGWAGESAATGQVQTLDIHDVYEGHEAEVN